MESSTDVRPLSVAFDNRFDLDLDASFGPMPHSDNLDSEHSNDDNSIQQTPITHLAPRKHKFFQVPAGRILWQHKIVTNAIGGELAVGITDIEDGVGVYAELTDGTYFAWHIKPPAIPSPYPGFVILNPLKDPQPSKRHLKRISHLHTEYLQVKLGELGQTMQESKLSLVTPEPTAVNVAIVKGILKWAGVKLKRGRDGTFWGAASRVIMDKDGFVIVRPDTAQWYLKACDNRAAEDSDFNWRKDWEAVEAGVEDGRGGMERTGGGLRERSERCIVI